MSDQIMDTVQRSPHAESDPQQEFAGGLAITDLAKATEIVVGQIVRRVEADAAAMALGAERNARLRVCVERQSLAAMRVELVSRASAVARGFGAVIELLDEADGLLTPTDLAEGASPACQQPEAASPPEPVTVPAEAPPEVAMAVSEARQPAKVRIAPEPPDAAEPSTPAGRPRRWWHRWTRQAA